MTLVLNSMIYVRPHQNFFNGYGNVYQSESGKTNNRLSGIIRMIEHLWLIPLGFASGLLGSMTGLGGGIITVPVMVFLGFPHTLAASNSLLATLSNAIASTLSYSRQKRIEYKLGLKLGLLSLPGTVVGAWVTSDVASQNFQLLFGIVLVVAATYLILKPRILKEKHDTRSQKQLYSFPRLMIVFLAGVSFFAGMTSSFFGIGGGIVFVPMMVAGLGMTIKRAAPTSQMILLFASLSGITVHGLLGNPDLLQASFMATGAFIGGLTGARLSIEARERNLRILTFGVILLASVKMFYDSLVADPQSS